MAFDAQFIAEGTVAIVMGPIYTVPGATKSYLKFFNLYNNSASTIVIDLRLRKGSGSLRKWRRISLDPDESYDVIEQDRSVELGATDSIQANASLAGVIEYTITGVNET